MKYNVNVKPVAPKVEFKEGTLFTWSSNDKALRMVVRDGGDGYFSVNLGNGSRSTALYPSLEALRDLYAGQDLKIYELASPLELQEL